VDILNIAGLREKLTALGDVEYEQKRRELAAEVGIRISVLDKTYRKLRGEQTRTARTPRPIIDPKSGDLPAILAKSWAALLENNKPVHLVNYGGAPARIIAPPDEAPRVEYLNVNSARYELANAAYWETTEGQPSRPDRDQIEMLLAAPTNPLPRLTRVVTIPVFDRDGKLIG